MEDLKMEEDDRYIETMRLLVDQLNLNKQYEEEGLTDDVLEKQVDINTRRRRFNIVDREQIIVKDKNGREFVQ